MSTAASLATTGIAASVVASTLWLSATAVPAAADTAGATTTVNIRSGPGTGTRVVGRLVRGQRISTAGPARRGWVPVRFDGGQAYMAARYLDLAGPGLPPAPRRIDPTGRKVATEDLNVRSGPGLNHPVVGRLAEGDEAYLTGRMTAGFAQLRQANRLRWASVQYLASVPSSTGSVSRGELVLAYARRQLGKPYRWGAEGPDRYDCSGLTMMAWQAAGVAIPRTSRQQYRSAGTAVARKDLRPGDLVFFYRAPSHVALYVGRGRILHAPRPGKVVQYANLDSMPYKGAVRPG